MPEFTMRISRLSKRIEVVLVSEYEALQSLDLSDQFGEIALATLYWPLQPIQDEAQLATGPAETLEGIFNSLAEQGLKSITNIEFELLGFESGRAFTLDEKEVLLDHLEALKEVVQYISELLDSYVDHGNLRNEIEHKRVTEDHLSSVTHPFDGPPVSRQMPQHVPEQSRNSSCTADVSSLHSHEDESIKKLIRSSSGLHTQVEVLPGHREIMDTYEDSDVLDGDMLYESEIDVATAGVSVHASPKSAKASREPVAAKYITRFIIAVDFGTTFTGVAFTLTHSNHVELREIEVMQEWTSIMSNDPKVPSVYAYPGPKQIQAQWGADISNDATTMVNMKLELHLQDKKAELDSTLSVLQGTGNLSFNTLRNPTYPAKTPTQVITDYLTEIRRCVCKTTKPNYLKVSETPLDLVITIPVDWSYEATNATFQALRAAGFTRAYFPTLEDMILVSEPEAASYFTVRDLNSRDAALLSVGDCFVLCDAGGGTVDVVAFQIKKGGQQCELKKITDAKSLACGSVYIDAAFKMWLRDILGADHYSKLDPANRGQPIKPHSIETCAMRELIKRFEVQKTRFSTNTYDVKIDLPAPLDRLDIPDRVNEGELTIYKDEMRVLFRYCMDSILDLIEEQMHQLEIKQNRRPKSVLLVGGFGASPYLQELLKDSLKMRKIKMHRPDHDSSWTAVVQGAEKHHHLLMMHAIRDSYGIVHSNDRFDWLVRKGDLMLSHVVQAACSKDFWIPTTDIKDHKLLMTLYRYSGDEDTIPDRISTGRHEVVKAVTVSCGLPRFKTRGYVGPFKVGFKLGDGSLVCTVFLNSKEIGQETIACKTSRGA
ncbi:hypothetical protein LTR10_000295 [Elasticomyces elasticus]|nr:hypothetical protein LTR10_000295 [Elasticomyces elasticus]KAK4980449.1 hypothetical protein LTR42_000756 [Elasticomyces elasticus]